MSEKQEKQFEQFHIRSGISRYLRQLAISLSFVVVLTVFWSLKLTGIGIAGEAFCGHEEHVHTESCADSENPCTLEEHIHAETCYSDINADLETSDDWEVPLADIALGPTYRENAVLIAKSQLGYQESTRNFQVDANGTRRGITRYGQWYGNPYGDWSAMFASFCLHYAGARDVPSNAGAESMRLEWHAAGLYQSAHEGTPEIGNLLFLRKHESGFGSSLLLGRGEIGSLGTNAVAIITGIDETGITVIEGDLDNTVAEAKYPLDSEYILGYGIVPTPAPEIVGNLTAEEYVPGEDTINAPGDCYIWLDGTDGGLGHLTGSPNNLYTLREGSIFLLPETWTSPSKYSYRLRGWYDVTNSRYYPPGGAMTVTGNAVLYADWVAATYDIGVFNAQVANTVSTNAFITTHMFDYNYLFNIQSSNAQVTVSNQRHSETWSMVTSGTVQYGDRQTQNLIFAEADSGGQLSNPNNRSDRNRYHSADTVSAGIYTAAIGELLFSPNNGFDPNTGTGILGKTYLGTGDHLFQIMTDPSDEYYGYYYYDSLRNASSYNQSEGRFYIYEYLSATADSSGGANADFIPLNSPYANTNGRTVRTYTFAGHHNEYNGVTHYRYDTSTSDSGVYTDFAYGMRSDIIFYLPNDPGTGGNKDLYGNDLEFEFSGDDDLWVLIDGIVVLDIGGIHQRVGGTIDFATGEVTVGGVQQPSLQELGITSGQDGGELTTVSFTDILGEQITEGIHTLTVYYMERGGSMSNCSIYFNIAPRFGLELKKEDVLTQELLNGAQFTVYEDPECTQPAQLWDSEADYLSDRADGVVDEYKSTFTVADGVARMWGMGSGNTYYIKETKPPDKEGYGLASGIIRLTVDKDGVATYHAEILPAPGEEAPSSGFTIHGVSIDETTKTIYIVVTNAPATVLHTTAVQVIKKWEDTADHSQDYITAYLTVTDPDGTVRRIREILLSDENGWMYTWTNLPKYDYSNLAEVQYGIEESYESGYYSTVRKITTIVKTDVEWAEAGSFLPNESYLLGYNDQYLSTTSDTDTKLKWVDLETAKASPLALWTVTFSGDTMKFTNGAGHILTYYHGSRSSSRYFYATTESTNYQYFSLRDQDPEFQLHAVVNGSRYYMGTSINSSGRIAMTTNSSRRMTITPIEKIITETEFEAGDWAYQITNTPLPASNETSMAVTKNWVIPEGYDATLYQEYAVTVRLLANGVNTGRSITLTLKNSWQGVFQGLPYKDEVGNVIQYTVDEVWEKPKWSTTYGEIRVSGDSPPTYSTVITNTYHPGGPELPATGSSARLLYMLCGSGIMLGSLVYGIGARRKRERRQT